MKKRPRRESQKPRSPSPGPLLFKVVELSLVDEGTLERTLNHWSAEGWTFDGMQFAMRESSKRPAMAFVTFTREGSPVDEPDAVDSEHAQDSDDRSRARLRLQRLGERAPALLSPRERLAQLAGDDDEEPFNSGGET